MRNAVEKQINRRICSALKLVLSGRLTQAKDHLEKQIVSDHADELLSHRRKGAPPGGSSYGGLNLLGFRCVQPLQPLPAPKSILDEMNSGSELAEAAEYYWDHGRIDQVGPPGEVY